MKAFKSIFLAIVAAFVTIIVGSLLLPMLGVELASSTLLYLGLGGAGLGLAAGVTENSILYAIIGLMVIIAGLSALWLTPASPVLSQMGFIGQLLGKVLATQSWVVWAIWGGVHVFVAMMMFYWVSNPSATLGEAIGATVETLIEIAGDVLGSVTTGLFAGLFAAITGNPVLLLLGAGALWWWLDKRKRNRGGDYVTESYQPQPQEETYVPTQSQEAPAIFEDGSVDRSDQSDGRFASDSFFNGPGLTA